MTWDHYRRYLTDNCMEYSDYIASKHWQAVRADFWKVNAKRRRCFTCGKGSRKRLEIHHKTYERMGGERMADLVLLCVKCHVAVHAIEKLGRAPLASAHMHLAKELESKRKPATKKAPKLKPVTWMVTPPTPSPYELARQEYAANIQKRKLKRRKSSSLYY